MTTYSDGKDVINTGSTDDVIDAGAGNDIVNSGAGDDTVDGGAGDDKISSGAGDDTVDGGSGNDNVDGGTGDDTLDGGSGSDTVNGGTGNDRLIYNMSENINAVDRYLGGSGTDIIELQFTLAQWADAAVQADVARYLAFLASKSGTGEIGAQFQFTAFNLTVQQFELLEVRVDNVLVNLTGNDNAIIGSGDVAGAAAELADLHAQENNKLHTDSGTFNFTDFDLGDSHSVVVTPQGSGYLGSFSASVSNDSTGDGAGQVSWSFEVQDSALDSLDGDQTVTQTYEVALFDGTSTVTQTVTVTISGANDAAVVTVTNVTDTEADASSATSFFIADKVSQTDVDTQDATQGYVDYVANSGSVSTSATGGASVPASGFSLNAATGEVTYDQDAFNVLDDGQSVVYTITFDTKSGDDAVQQQTLTVTIAGANDAPVISVGADDEDSAGLDETNGALSISGTLTVTDVDATDSVDVSVTEVSVGGTGSTSLGSAALLDMFSIGDNGAWTFDSGSEAFDNLAAGQTLVLTYTVVADDGDVTDDHTVTITITGTNDAATIGGDNAGAVAEDGDLADGGTLTIADADDGEAELQPLADQAGDNGYGTFNVAADGTWTYDLDNDAVQALSEGETVTDTITVTSEDSTDTDVITVTITGDNDAATIGGDNAGAVAEDGDLADGGTLTIADADDGEAELQPLTNEAGDYGYGTFNVAADGTWSYDLDNDAVQGLSEGELAYDTITVTSEDSTDTDVITVTITGDNDAATIGGDNAGAVAEDGDISDGGTLTIADADDGEAELQPLADVAGDNGYGTFNVAANGTWTYDLDNDAVQGLSEGETVTDTITVTSEDSTDTDVITVTITGDNDAASIGGTDTGSVTEDGTLVANGALTIDDADDGEESFQAANLAGAYGSLALLADGSWSYTLNNSDPDLATLDTGDSAVEQFTVQSADGTTHQIDVTVNGATDAAPPSSPAVYNGLDDTNDYDTAPSGATLYTSFTTSQLNGDNAMKGTTGGETIDAKSGADTVYALAGDDTIIGGQGIDTIYGGEGVDTIHGDQDTDNLYGGSGNDVVYGSQGNDVIVGGFGADTLTGDGNADTFLYIDVRDTGDTITDFEVGVDEINFAGIDGNTGQALDQAFAWGGNVNGVIAYSVTWYYDGVKTHVWADNNGDAVADIEILLTGNIVLSESDFGL